MELPDAVWQRSRCGHRSDFIDSSGMCLRCAQRQIPSIVNDGRRTPTWTAQSVPKGLLKAHHTSAWAELVVESGHVTFLEEGSSQRIDAGSSIVIVPHQVHHIECSEDAELYVQFYDFPEAIAQAADDASAANPGR